MLDRILVTKRQEIARAKQQLSLKALTVRLDNSQTIRDFNQALLTNINKRKPAVIAEIKKASPSRGLIREDFNPKALAKSYQIGGASCLSVLTDNTYFRGNDKDLLQAKNACNLPVLRKDFIIDEYQIYQSYLLGADCVLLIVAAFSSDDLLTSLSELAKSLGMAVLVEVHNKLELQRALKLDLPIIGINNRNLKTFKTSLQTTIDLLPLVPKGVYVISESAIFTNDDIKLLQQYGVGGFLVGEALMGQSDVSSALKNLIGGLNGS